MTFYIQVFKLLLVQPKLKLYYGTMGTDPTEQCPLNALIWKSLTVDCLLC